MQKGKKWKKAFPHLGIELKTSRAEILDPIKTEQTFYVVMPRSTCFHSKASSFIHTGWNLKWYSYCTIWDFNLINHVELFWQIALSATCDFNAFISTAICESSRSPFSRLQEKYWIKFQEFESWLSSKGQRISSKTSPKPERVVRIKIILSFVDITNVMFVTSYDNWVWASS